jgi:phosphotransferase system  glucose/maltose/N-acetylglucosamine-specific IIC component
MRQIRYATGRRPGNVLTQAIGLIFGLIVFVIAVVVGGIVLAAVIGLVLIAWLVIYLRFLWLAKKRSVPGRDGEQFVEAEYHVVETTTTDDVDR